MNYVLIKQKRKTFKIKITDDCSVEVYAPVKSKLEDINKFVLKNINWIQKNLNLKKEVLNKNQDIITYKSFYYMGSIFKLLKVKQGYNIGDYLIKTRSNNQKEIIKKFLKECADKYLIDRLDYISKQLCIPYNKSKIISAKSKWGSCDSLKNISLNFKLIMLPKNLIDYVICHELCHTKELNHSVRFWGLLKKIGYEKSIIRKEMAKYGILIRLF